MAATLKLCHASGLASRSLPATWLWEGLLATGMITLLTSRWKAGKTTLISLLLARLGICGQVAGAVAPCRAVVLSEEPHSVWEERHRRLNFPDNVEFACRPFHGRPTAVEWEGFIVELAADKPGLVVVDPLAMFLPGNVENQPASLLNALRPLHRLTDAGAAVLLLHHPRKGGNPDEMSPRGSGALTGFVDIIAELDRPREAANDRVRRLKVVSRLAGPASFRIELSPDSTEYTRMPETPDPVSFDTGWPILKEILENASIRPTRASLLKFWPEDYEKPTKYALLQWLERAEKEGLIERRGTGRHHDAFCYGLAGQVFPMDAFDIPRLEPLSYFPKPKAKGKKK